MDLQKFYDNILKDLKVELKDEFDKNFQRKAFFGKKWPKEKLVNRRGSLMARTNKLRHSINADIMSDGIKFSSSLPYASIHNEGGTVIVTKKMKSFFWYMYYSTAGKMTKNKNGKMANNSRNRTLSVEAQQWKNLALMKIGQKIEMPERRFIGDDPKVKEAIDTVVQDNLKELNEAIMNKLKQK